MPFCFIKCALMLLMSIPVEASEVKLNESARVQEAFETSVRVRVLKPVRVVNLEGYGLSFQDVRGQIHRASRLPTKTQAVVTLSSDRHWRVEFPDGSYLDLVADTLKVDGEFLKLSGARVPDSFDLRFVGRGQFEGILRLNLEDYLKGVLPSEMPAHWPLEALKAQAVAARSYVVSMIRERRAQSFDVESSILDQVYQFENYLNISTKNQKKIQQAVEETRGYILFQPSGEVHRSFYHAHCGGHTEVAERVWGNGQEDRSSLTVADRRCALTRSFKWSFSVPREELEAHLGDRFNQSQAPSSEEAIISEVRPEGVSASGRVSHLRFRTKNGSETLVSTQDFRQMMGFNKVKSTLFELSWDGHNLKLEGQGHGHGVGMCQHGARFMAKAGRDYQAIINRYYPKAQLARLGGKDEQLHALNLTSVENDNKRP